MGNPDQLIEYALATGADRAAVLSAGDIVIDAGLADKCRECPNYGLAKSCPPNVGGPAVLKKELKEFHQALVFTMGVPPDDLFTDNRRRHFQRLHRLAAGIEQAARRMGFDRARGYAGGSCREIFCCDYQDCPALSGKNKCRYPRDARPSMSGFGVDVSRLFETAGWTLTLADPRNNAGDDKAADLCGLVLIG